MAVASNLVATRNILKTQSHDPCRAAKSIVSLRRNHDSSMIARKNQQNRKRLVKISTAADGKWGNRWSTQYKFSLLELQLQDLATEVDDKETPVYISLHIQQQHASFGFSVDGKIVACFATKCSSCCLPYSRKIDTDFSVLILSSKRSSGETQIPQIGNDDDQVIYVKPGYEADLDTLIQDAIRLAISVKDTCSESCEKAAPRIQCKDFLPRIRSFFKLHDRVINHTNNIENLICRFWRTEASCYYRWEVVKIIRIEKYIPTIKPTIVFNFVSWSVNLCTQDKRFSLQMT